MRLCIAQPYEGLIMYDPLTTAPREIKVPIERIVSHVCAYYSIPKYQILSNSRKHEVVAARMVAVYMIKTFHPKIYLAPISKLFSKHYSTIIYAINTIDDLLSYDRKLKNDIEVINARIRNSN